jgi:putative selenium metabolism hydrolase
VKFDDALQDADAPASQASSARGLIEFAQRLISTPSPSEKEADVAKIVAAELIKLGYRNVEVDPNGNVTGIYGSGEPLLMYNGHLDHVPPAGMIDPYSAELVDATTYGEPGVAIRGRGACDMKGNVAAGAYAVAFLEKELRNGSYLFTADIQEETDSPLGIPELLRRGLVAPFGLSGESTGLDVALGHRGKIQADITVEGRSSHASEPTRGLNAVFRTAPFLAAVQDLAVKLPTDDLYGDATVTVTQISSVPVGDVAVVPSSCTIRVDRRYLPSEGAEYCLKELERLVEEISAREGIDARVELVNIYPLMQISPDHELVSHGVRAVESVVGQPPKVKAWRFGVNATFMSEAGIPTIGIGPGNEYWAHTPDEHISVRQLVQASRIYAALLPALAP